MSDGERHTFHVSGMSCEHCVAAVGEKVRELPGVSTVEVDLVSGAVLVSGSDLDGEDVRVAVEAAGYSLTERA